MADAVQQRYEAKWTDEKKTRESWNTEMQYKSKVAAEKIKAETAIANEKHQDKVDTNKLPESTVANKWAANMPEHHLEGYPKDKAFTQQQAEEDSSDDESSDEE